MASLDWPPPVVRGRASSSDEREIQYSVGIGQSVAVRVDFVGEGSRAELKTMNREGTQ